MLARHPQNARAVQMRFNSLPEENLGREASKETETLDRRVAGQVFVSRFKEERMEVAAG